MVFRQGTLQRKPDTPENRRVQGTAAVATLETRRVQGTAAVATLETRQGLGIAAAATLEQGSRLRPHTDQHPATALHTLPGKLPALVTVKKFIDLLPIMHKYKHIMNNNNTVLYLLKARHTTLNCRG